MNEKQLLNWMLKVYIFAEGELFFIVLACQLIGQRFFFNDYFKYFNKKQA